VEAVIAKTIIDVDAAGRGGSAAPRQPSWAVPAVSFYYFPTEAAADASQLTLIVHAKDDFAGLRVDRNPAALTASLVQNLNLPHPKPLVHASTSQLALRALKQ
jgi:hypothetical protein